MNRSQRLNTVGDDSRLIQALAEYEQRIQSSSDHTCRESILASYADIADELEACLNGLSVLNRFISPELTPSNSVLNLIIDPTNIEIPGYRITREIGRGGMGIVFEAQQESLNRTVAIKVLPTSSLVTELRRQRFQNEARSAALLTHPGIVKVIAVGSVESADYFSMEFIDGPSFSQILDHLRDNTQSPIDPSDFEIPFVSDLKECVGEKLDVTDSRYFRMIAAKIIEITSAIHYAHGEGIIHRDIKPSNLLLDGEGRPFIADFGLARVESPENLTATGDVVGTLRYMSPEQATGKNHIVDHRADVYSLGVTLYEMLTLQFPYDGESHGEVLRKITDDSPLPLRKLQPLMPADLEMVVLKSIAKEPNDRYSSARELADDLQRFLDRKPVLAKRPGIVRQLALVAKRNPKFAAASIACLLFAFTAVVLGLMYGSSNNLAQLRHQQIQRTSYANDMNAVLSAIQSGRADKARTILRKHESSGAWKNIEHRILRQMAESELVAFSGNESTTRSISVSPDGKLVATGGTDNKVYLWNSETGTQLHCFVHPTGAVGGPLFLKDNRTLVCSGDKIRLFDLTNFKLMGEYSNRNVRSFTRLAIDSNEKTLVSGTSGSVVLAWEIVRNGNKVDLKFKKLAPGRELGRRVWILGFDISPDGRFVAWGNDKDSTLWIWDRFNDELFSRQSKVDVGDNQKNIASCDFSPDGKLLATGEWDNKVRIWDTTTWTVVREHDEHDDIIRSVAFHPDGKSIYAGGYDGSLIRWDIENGNILNEDSDQRRAIGNITVTDSGNIVFVAVEEGLGKLRDRQSTGYNRNSRGSNRAISRIIKFQADDLTPVHPSRCVGELSHLEFRYREREFSAIDYSHESQRLALGFMDGSMVVEDLKAIDRLRLTSTNEITTGIPTSQFPAPIRTILLADDPQRPDHVSSDGFAQFTSIDSKIVRNQKMFNEQSRIHRYSDGSMLVVTLRNGKWFSSDRESVLPLYPEIPANTNQVRISRSGDYLAIELSDGTVSCWRVSGAIAQPIAEMQGLEVGSSMAISPDGQWIATGYLDGQIELFSVQQEKKIRTLSRHLHRVSALAFSADSSRLVSGSHDQSVHIWDIASGQSVVHLENHEGTISHVEFAPDNSKLIVASRINYAEEHSIVRIWQAAENF